MRSNGFTLVEMVITVAIVGLLATAVFPLAELGVRRAKEQDLRAALRTIRDGLDAYKAASDAGRIEMELGDSGYPETLDLLVEGVRDIKDPDGNMIYLLRRLPRDPFYPDSSAAAADTWAQRSYESPPDDPQPGDDIFDVHSISQKVGLNGTPYDTW
ncbi:MAG: type II secretion system protein [Gammaproteobacteria bacterium]|nr:type II secretion system protein [Gammaproteobacteria bacterium]